jgi:hypothetical protein
MKKRMPVAFLPHGGGPVTHVEMGFEDGRRAAGRVLAARA